MLLWQAQVAASRRKPLLELGHKRCTRIQLLFRQASADTSRHPRAPRESLPGDRVLVPARGLPEGCGGEATAGLPAGGVTADPTAAGGAGPAPAALGGSRGGRAAGYPYAKNMRFEQQWYQRQPAACRSCSHLKLGTWDLPERLLVLAGGREQPVQGSAWSRQSLRGGTAGRGSLPKLSCCW